MADKPVVITFNQTEVAAVLFMALFNYDDPQEAKDVFDKLGRDEKVQIMTAARVLMEYFASKMNTKVAGIIRETDGRLDS